MKVDRLLLLVIALLFLSGSFVNAGPVGDFFKKVGHSISKPLQSQPPPPPQSTPPSACEHAARHATTDFASSTCGRRNAARSRTTITPSQRAHWQCAACFSRGYRKSKSWFALCNSGPRPERYGHESLSAGRGQVYRCH